VISPATKDVGEITGALLLKPDGVIVFPKPLTVLIIPPLLAVVVTVKFPVVPSNRAFLIWHFTVSVDRSGASRRISSPLPSRCRLMRLLELVGVTPPVKLSCEPYSSLSPKKKTCGVVHPLMSIKLLLAKEIEIVASAGILKYPVEKLKVAMGYSPAT